MSEARILWGAGTPRTLRAHWMLHELELPYERRPIGSRTGETQTKHYGALNPSRKIPCLEDGDFVLAESGAIVNYLATVYGEGRFAPPSAPRERARYDQWCFFVLMELDANTMYIIRRHADLKEVYGEAPRAVDAASLCFAQQAKAAAERLGQAPYAMGDRFTGADILLTSCLTGALRRGIDLPGSLLAYTQRISARPAYIRAQKANQRAAPAR